MGSQHQTAPEKPAEGHPCNGCGMCCAAEPCGIAVEFLGATEGPCPAMQFEGGRFWCGMTRTPGAYMGAPDFADGILGPMFAEALGIGRGCDSDAAPTGAKD
jgi:hypothetical protein